MPLFVSKDVPSKARRLSGITLKIPHKTITPNANETDKETFVLIRVHVYILIFFYKKREPELPLKLLSIKTFYKVLMHNFYHNPDAHHQHNPKCIHQLMELLCLQDFLLVLSILIHFEFIRKTEV